MRKPGARLSIIAVLLLGMLIFGGVYYAWNTTTDIFQPVDNTGKGQNVAFEVESGETTAQIADRLQEKGLIRNALAFRVWARIKGLDTKLQAGIYSKLNSSMSISEITDQLLNAQPDAIRVLIIEGWRLEQIASKFASSKLANFKASDFLKYTKRIKNFPDANKYTILKGVNGNKSMEGFLFPSSYEVPVDADAKDVVNLLVKTMDDMIVNNKLDQAAKKKNMNVYTMLTLASIVEREARGNADRSIIASVYWNRDSNTTGETVGLLQADPTVQYARDTQTPPKSGKYWSPLQDLGRNIAVDSPWNTYIFKGFPPTPICSPSFASLKAAATHKDTDYYYFFADTSGVTHFAKTHAEFEQMMQQYGVSQG